MPRSNTLARAACLALALGMAAAIALQDWTGPFAVELTNRELATYRLLSLVALSVCVVVCLVFAVELLRGGRSGPGRALRRLLLAAVATELVLSLVDVGFVSGAPQSRLGGPFFELRTR